MCFIPDIINVSKIDELAQNGINNIVAAIGVFDGLHIGHRKLIMTLTSLAKESDAVPVIITFHPHPRVVLMHDTKLRFLRSPESKQKILQELGVKAIVTIPFDLNFAALPPNDFINSFLITEKVTVKGICVGTSWKFGNKARGNISTLRKFSKLHGYKFKAVEELKVNERLVSSTAIRTAIKQGNFESANFMLATDYIIEGQVSRSDSTGSKKYKTKIDFDFGILPEPGYYDALIFSNRIRVEVIGVNQIIFYSTKEFVVDSHIQIKFLNSRLKPGTD